MIENLEAILLGAGLSKRMGTQKLLLPFANGTVIGTVLENLRGAGFAQVNAVLSREVAASLAPYPAWLRVEINEAPERGQSSSLAIGLEMTNSESDFCIMLADLPLARAEDIAALASRFCALSPLKSVLTPCRDGVFGHPMFYRALWRRRFAQASGDMGGRAILKKYEAEIERVEAGGGHFKDMDTPEDYQARLKGL